MCLFLNNDEKKSIKKQYSTKIVTRYIYTRVNCLAVKTLDISKQLNTHYLFLEL